MISSGHFLCSLISVGVISSLSNPEHCNFSLFFPNQCYLKWETSSWGTPLLQVPRRLLLWAWLFVSGTFQGYLHWGRVCIPPCRKLAVYWGRENSDHWSPPVLLVQQGSGGNKGAFSKEAISVSHGLREHMFSILGAIQKGHKNQEVWPDIHRCMSDAEKR